jgi:hypothetical protein|tara:strand:+ start:124 stop:345 length:222 start_codon:yes stop_codon:yes gene_type:complete
MEHNCGCVLDVVIHNVNLVKRTQQHHPSTMQTTLPEPAQSIEDKRGLHNMGKNNIKRKESINIQPMPMKGFFI